ncbi:hypothetical protein GCM10009676_37390 [Prauserella halophila]|uniref:Uncharacterized protein n=1 Tax=Prauserella halophila TaxID=185641 RepID=A0ABN1WF00_9PSEU|nr:hypothetical protein [Prauserella halophila]
MRTGHSIEPDEQAATDRPRTRSTDPERPTPGQFNLHISLHTDPETHSGNMPATAEAGPMCASPDDTGFSMHFAEMAYEENFG